jgi:hypothetical protein
VQAVSAGRDMTDKELQNILEAYHLDEDVE